MSFHKDSRETNHGWSGDFPFFLFLLYKTSLSQRSTLIGLRYRSSCAIMAEAPANTKPRYLFVVYAPDYTDEECFTRRLAVRQQHLVNATKSRHNIIISKNSIRWWYIMVPGYPLTNEYRGRRSLDHSGYLRLGTKKDGWINYDIWGG